VIAVVERLLAILALVAMVTAIATTVALSTRRVPAWLRDDVALPLAAAIATVATAGSLYLSEVAGYLPCTLCWYQRIAMYPLVVILGVAAWRRDRAVWLTALPLAAVGSAIAVWHIAIERRPGLGGVCDPSAPCSLRWVEEFGFLTLPTMALIGFVAIGVLSLAARNGTSSDDTGSDDTGSDDTGSDDTGSEHPGHASETSGVVRPTASADAPPRRPGAAPATTTDRR
jgi:disulfide bond formation protein DsbB